MDALPLVSVIIPLYEHERWITECIESIIRSSYPRLELLVLDDGSSDNSFSIATALVKENRNRFERVWIDTQRNMGITRTLNKLVSNSSGKYIYSLASDDEVTPGGIEKCVTFCEANNVEDALVITNVEMIDENGNPCRDTKMDGYLRGAPDWIARCDLILHWGAPYQHQFYSRRAYESVGGYDESFHYEDLYFALRFCGRGKVHFIFDKIKRYRLHRNGLPTPGVSAEQLRQSPIYHEASKSARPMQRCLMLLAATSEKSPVSRVIMWLISGFVRRMLLPVFRKPLRAREPA